MKGLLRAMVMILIVIFQLSCTIEPHRYTIISTGTGNDLSLRKLAEELSEYDVVVFGEYPGNNTIHYIQAQLLPFYIREAGDIAISMDIFARDVQRVIERYLFDEIPEPKFIAESRAPHTYMIDYKAIIEFAKIEGVPVLAANVPRWIVNRVSRYGLKELERIPYEERFLFAEEVELTYDSYRDNFFITNINDPQIVSLDKDFIDAQLGNLYAAQSLKDDTMAETINNFYRRNRDRKIIHFVNHTHSTRRLGVVTKLKSRNPSLRIAVISPVIIHHKNEIPSAYAMRGIGDYVIIIEE